MLSVAALLPRTESAMNAKRGVFPAGVREFSVLSGIS